jgi:hypothetical protein
MNAPNILQASPPHEADAARSVLVFWRSFAADEFGAARRARVGAFVTRAAIADARWRLAAAGDAASAIGIALSRRSTVFPDLRFDVGMTAVLYCALQGDAAARVVLASMVRGHGDRITQDRIAASWGAPAAATEGEA